MTESFDANVDRFSGFADSYDQYRPQPPAVIVDLLSQLAGTSQPNLVVDIGSGTGLSTRLWAGRANRVIGIEPNADMRRQAVAATLEARSSRNITYQDGSSTATGLADGCADIVTCSQALHWMEPAGTLAEVARILRGGGVFAACDCDWPPAINVQAEAAYERFIARVHELEQQHQLSKAYKWAKEQHLERMAASGGFRFTREVVLHNIEWGGADRLIGLAMSQGGFRTLVKGGLTPEQLGVDQLVAEAREALGLGEARWFFSYRVRIGVK